MDAERGWLIPENACTLIRPRLVRLKWTGIQEGRKGGLARSFNIVSWLSLCTATNNFTHQTIIKELFSFLPTLIRLLAIHRTHPINKCKLLWHKLFCIVIINTNDMFFHVYCVLVIEGILMLIFCRVISYNKYITWVLAVVEKENKNDKNQHHVQIQERNGKILIWK